jgi:hypothetical protein
MEAARALKEAKDIKDGKKKGEKADEKSLIVLEVKPWEADTDLGAVWKMIVEVCCWRCYACSLFVRSLLFVAHY